MPRGGSQCEPHDPWACWGNGVCDTSTRRCACGEGWTGANCTVLDVAPAPPDGAIRRAGWSSWGGSPIRDGRGRIHLFASQMANHCPLGTWQNNSLVIHAIADNLTGPFVVQEAELVLPPFHHNPSVQRAPDGTYLIYCIGSKAGRCPGGGSGNCTGSTIKHCAPPDALAMENPTSSLPSTEHLSASNTGLDGVIHLAHSKSLSGPWSLQPSDQPVLTGRPGRWDEQSTNPAPHLLPNGTALLVYRGVNGLGTDRIGAAKASQWSGSYSRVVDLPVFGRCGNWTSSRETSTAPADTGCTPVHNWTASLDRPGPPPNPGLWNYVCDECVGWAEGACVCSPFRAALLGSHINGRNY